MFFFYCFAVVVEYYSVRYAVVLWNEIQFDFAYFHAHINSSWYHVIFTVFTKNTHSSNLNMFKRIKLLISIICFLKSITFAILNYMLEHFICGIIYTYHSNILSASSPESLDTIICYTQCMSMGRTLWVQQIDESCTVIFSITFYIVINIICI